MSEVEKALALIGQMKRENGGFLEDTFEFEAVENGLRRLRLEREGLREALEAAHHELTTLHNLDASDDPERLFRNPFTIDTSAVREKIDKALKSLPAPEAGEKVSERECCAGSHCRGDCDCALPVGACHCSCESCLDGTQSPSPERSRRERELAVIEAVRTYKRAYDYAAGDIDEDPGIEIGQADTILFAALLALDAEPEAPKT